MTTLIIERSTEIQSLAWMDSQGNITSEILNGAGVRSGDWASRVALFLANREPQRILVGTGPGSFAGIRAALAFAQGYAIGSKCEVVGLPSPCALATSESRVVIGDSRRGLFWVALFEGRRLATPIFQVHREDLFSRVPRGLKIVSPDAKRIDSDLREIFGDAYIGEAMPLASDLAIFARENESALIREPLPLYLNPAVRPAE